MKDTTVLGIGALISLTILETIALLQGIDGSMMAFVLFIIGSIAGVSFKDKIVKILKR